MNNYSVSFKNGEGMLKTISISAKSATHAIILVMERYASLQLHPNRITRVLKEEQNG